MFAKGKENIYIYYKLHKCRLQTAKYLPRENSPQSLSTFRARTGVFHHKAVCPRAWLQGEVGQHFGWDTTLSFDLGYRTDRFGYVRGHCKPQPGHTDSHQSSQHAQILSRFKNKNKKIPAWMRPIHPLSWKKKKKTDLYISACTCKCIYTTIHIHTPTWR